MYVSCLLLVFGPQGSGGDQECIFFTLNTYQPTFISDTLHTPAGIGNSKVGRDADADADAVRTDRRECRNSYVDIIQERKCKYHKHNDLVCIIISKIFAV